MDQDEKELVGRAKDGDLGAFDELVLRYRSQIVGLIYRLMGRFVDGEDLAQEVFFRAYLGLKRFLGESSFKTWLYTIATNLCVDHGRKRKGKMMISLDGMEEQGGQLTGSMFPQPRLRRPRPWRDLRGLRPLLGSGNPGPEEMAQTAEVQSFVQKALQELPPHHRTVVVLHDIHGVPYEEIARIVGCPLGTVKSRSHYARELLRKKLAPLIEGG